MAEKKNRKRLFAIAVITVLCLFTAALAYSFWPISGSTINFLTMASYQNRIEEEYEIPHHVNPSEEVTKIVHVSNTGTVDTLVRVMVKKAFGERRGDGSFVEEKSLDPEMIEITFNESCWMTGKDGYHYYKGILGAGMTTKEPLFTSYRLSEKAGNEYKGKDAQISVTMESVQAQGDAVSIWGITHRELGVVRPEAPESEDTSVAYLGESSGFDITSRKTDLFASFKNLFPGCARTQKIFVKNDSQENVEILLRAEPVSQKRMSSEQKRLVEQMLKKYALIEITDGQRQLYKGNAAGNLNGSGSTMKNNISLGNFTAGREKELTVKLSLAPEMDNRFQELTGKVKWVFTAIGEGEKTQSAIVPSTGDSTRTGMWIALLVTSAMFLAGAFWIERKIEKAEKNESTKTRD